MKFNDSVPRSADIIEEQLDDLRRKLFNIIVEGGHESVLNDFIDSKHLHYRRLKEEFKTAQWLEKNYDMEIAIESKEFFKKAIPATFLGRLLGYIQNLRLSTSDAISIYGGKCEVSVVKTWKENQLMAADFKAPDFATQLSYNRSTEPPFLSDPDSFRSGEDLFLILLSDSAAPEDYDIITKSPRLLCEYLDFLSFLVQYDVVMSARTKAHPFGVRISSQNAKVRKEFLKPFCHKMKEEIEILGILVMGDIAKNEFSIERFGANYFGGISSQGAEGLKLTPISATVKAKLLATILEDGDLFEGDIRPNYTLLSIINVD
jgi:hypothetical protein